MKIKKLELKDFMLFHEFDEEWSENINIIGGSNSTGKTALLKLMYSLLSAYWATDTQKDTKDETEKRFVDKLTHVFRPENMKIGRLARRKQGTSRAEGKLSFSESDVISFGFGSGASTHMECELPKGGNTPSPDKSAVYFPPKEIISSTENFRALYEDMHIAFEETYNDLARLLARPLKKGKNTDEQNAVLHELGDIMDGTISQRDNKFYLSVSGKGEFEMGLVSEGYRKLATIAYLIQNGSLNSNSVLFWDEPETNMNPKMIEPLVRMVMQLAKLGVQVFITTHDYFIQQYFNMYMAYEESNPDRIDIRFYSLTKDENGDVQTESASTISDLEHNSIMEEFDAIYDREQDMLYERIRKQN